MKKIWGVLIAVVFLFAIISNVSATDLDSVKGGLEDVEEAAKNVGDVTKTIEEKRWEYIGEKWGEIFLNNPTIAKIDTGLKKMNFVFFFLFGEDYALSLIFAFVIMFWFVFLVSINGIIAGFSTFSKGVSSGMSFILTIIIAQFGFYRDISELLFKVIFFKEGIWGWLFLIAVFIGIVTYIIMSGKVARWIRKWKVARKWRERLERQKAEQDILHNTVSVIGRAATE